MSLESPLAAGWRAGYGVRVGDAGRPRGEGRWPPGEEGETVAWNQAVVEPMETGGSWYIGKWTELKYKHSQVCTGLRVVPLGRPWRW